MDKLKNLANMVVKEYRDDIEKYHLSSSTNYLDIRNRDKLFRAINDIVQKHGVNFGVKQLYNRLFQCHLINYLNSEHSGYILKYINNMITPANMERFISVYGEYNKYDFGDKSLSAVFELGYGENLIHSVPDVVEFISVNEFLQLSEQDRDYIVTECSAKLDKNLVNSKEFDDYKFKYFIRLNKKNKLNYIKIFAIYGKYRMVQ